MLMLRTESCSAKVIFIPQPLHDHSFFIFYFLFKCGIPMRLLHRNHIVVDRLAAIVDLYLHLRMLLLDFAADHLRRLF